MIETLYKYYLEYQEELVKELKFRKWILAHQAGMNSLSKATFIDLDFWRAW